MSYKKPCTAEEQLDLAVRAHAGDRAAFDDLVASQSGLVRKIAVSYAKQSGHIEIDDLIQEGYLAVMDAIRWFDPQRGYKFSTYSGDCIRRRLHKWLQLRQIAPICAQEPGANASGDNPLENTADEEISNLADDLSEMLRQLPPLYRCVVCKRRGLAGEQMPVAEICQCLGLGMHRERKIYQRAYEALTCLL